MATPGRVGLPPCRRTRTPRQACARWVKHHILVPAHDACGSLGRCHVLLAHRPRHAAHALSLADGRACIAAPFAILRPCHGPHLVWPQLGAQANTSTASSRPYKPSFSTRVSTQPPPSAIGAVPVNSISATFLRERELLLTPLGPPVALPSACCSGRAASSPEFELPRPPGKPCRARAPARSPSQWAHVAPPLGHPEALHATHFSVESFPSPDFTPPWPCCLCAAAAARRQPLRPSYHRQALRGEPNRTSPSLVCHPVLHLTAGDLTFATGFRGGEPRVWL
jgi:hypothetical protein